MSTIIRLSNGNTIAYYSMSTLSTYILNFQSITGGTIAPNFYTIISPSEGTLLFAKFLGVGGGINLFDASGQQLLAYSNTTKNPIQWLKPNAAYMLSISYALSIANAPFLELEFEAASDVTAAGIVGMFPNTLSSSEIKGNIPEVTIVNFDPYGNILMDVQNKVVVTGEKILIGTMRKSLPNPFNYEIQVSSASGDAIDVTNYTPITGSDLEIYAIAKENFTIINDTWIIQGVTNLATTPVRPVILNI